MKDIFNTTGAQSGHQKLAFSTKESADVLGVSEKSIYRLIQRGKLRCMSSFRHKRIPRSELERFLKDDIQ